MVTAAAFTALVVLVAWQRVMELMRSRRHTRALLAAGGHEHARWQTAVLAAVHTSWLISMGVEVWWFDPPWRTGLAVAAALAFASGQILRRAAMRGLGPRWTIGIVTMPNTPAITTGIYRHLRHPNYLGVILEIAALPLIHGAYRTALVFSAVNALALFLRIRAEERALTVEGDYASLLADRPRFVPLARARKAR